MKWDSFLHFMTYFDISRILSSHNFCEASWVGWQLSGPTCGHTLDTAVSTVTTEQQCLVPGTMCRQYTELFICPAPHQKQPGEIMTINISLGGAHWWCPLYVVVIFPIFAAPPGGHHGQCVESGADTICRWQPGSGQSGDITADKLRL